MVDVGIFYAHWVYSTAIRYNVWQSDIFLFIWYIFPRFGILYQEKSGNPGQDGNNLSRWFDFVSEAHCDSNRKPT
jgi:hypothetical protein